MSVEFEIVPIKVPEGVNLVVGQAHFIKATEDLYEALVNSVPDIRFGLAFCEASGPCLVRYEGNDEELRKLAAETTLRIGAGHCFVVFMKNAYPINVLNAIKSVPEVCYILCATANPVQIIVAKTDQGRAMIGVVDGYSLKGVERNENVKERRGFLRKIGYKL